MESIPVTLNPDDMGSGFTLSNGNLTFVSTTDYRAIRATHGKSYGKWYWEVRYDSGVRNVHIGISNKQFLLSGNFVPDSTSWRTYYGNTGNKYPDNTTYSTVWDVGNIVGVALDLDNGILEFFKNGVSMGVSHTNIKLLGEVFPTLGSFSGNSKTVTVNFGATPFVYGAPAGFKAYNLTYSYKFLISSEDNYYSVISKYKDNSVPAMTSNILPSGIVEASSTYSTFYPWKAFDRMVDQNGWVTASGVLVGWLSYEFASPKTLTGYSLKTGTTPVNRPPKTWTFEGWNDGQWIILDTRVNEPNFASEEFRFYKFKNNLAYKKYRINVTANQGAGDFLAIGDFGMYESERYISCVQNTENDFVRRGINKGMTINLDDEFTERRLWNRDHSQLGVGKVFKQKIDTSKTPIKQVSFT
ncbi:SPRY domain-containing protein [Paenibacillus sp. FSL R7-0272]|uniref:SPRY domain-containing protein n=1 Tax=Paenibacillus sp. FSL R7-0272 TaxID=2921679 RepID=UPI0030EE9F2F